VNPDSPVIRVFLRACHINPAAVPKPAKKDAPATWKPSRNDLSSQFDAPAQTVAEQWYRRFNY
jgi:hypothetical protein